MVYDLLPFSPALRKVTLSMTPLVKAQSFLRAPTMLTTSRRGFLEAAGAGTLDEDDLPDHDLGAGLLSPEGGLDVGALVSKG